MVAERVISNSLRGGAVSRNVAQEDEYITKLPGTTAGLNENLQPNLADFFPSPSFSFVVGEQQKKSVGGYRESSSVLSEARSRLMSPEKGDTHQNTTNMSFEESGLVDTIPEESSLKVSKPLIIIGFLEKLSQVSKDLVFGKDSELESTDASRMSADVAVSSYLDSMHVDATVVALDSRKSTEKQNYSAELDIQDFLGVGITPVGYSNSQTKDGQTNELVEPLFVSSEVSAAQLTSRDAEVDQSLLNGKRHVSSVSSSEVSSSEAYETEAISCAVDGDFIKHILSSVKTYPNNPSASWSDKQFDILFQSILDLANGVKASKSLTAESFSMSLQSSSVKNMLTILKAYSLKDLVTLCWHKLVNITRDPSAANIKIFCVSCCFLVFRDAADLEEKLSRSLSEPSVLETIRQQDNFSFIKSHMLSLMEYLSQNIELFKESCPDSRSVLRDMINDFSLGKVPSCGPNDQLGSQQDLSHASVLHSGDIPGIVNGELDNSLFDKALGLRSASPQFFAVEFFGRMTQKCIEFVDAIYSSGKAYRALEYIDSEGSLAQYVDPVCTITEKYKDLVPFFQVHLLKLKKLKNKLHDKESVDFLSHYMNTWVHQLRTASNKFLQETPKTKGHILHEELKARVRNFWKNFQCCLSAGDDDSKTIKVADLKKQLVLFAQELKGSTPHLHLSISRGLKYYIELFLGFLGWVFLGNRKSNWSYTVEDYHKAAVGVLGDCLHDLSSSVKDVDTSSSDVLCASSQQDRQQKHAESHSFFKFSDSELEQLILVRMRLNN